MNVYLQALAGADEARRTHHERAAAQTRAHFAAHPECAFKILSMDDEGNVRRGKTQINIDARCRPNWFTMPMWKQEPDDERPLEDQRSESSGYWYRVDDLRHPVAPEESGTPATQEMGGLIKRAMVLHKVAVEVEARERAERAQQRREKRARQPKKLTIPSFVGAV